MNRRPLLVGVGGAIVIALAWYAFLWSPQTKALAKGRRDAAAAEAKLAKTRAAAVRAEGGDPRRRRGRLVHPRGQ